VETTSGESASPLSIEPHAPPVASQQVVSEPEPPPEREPEPSAESDQGDENGPTRKS
jgi:hypothetical protein